MFCFSLFHSLFCIVDIPYFSPFFILAGVLSCGAVPCFILSFSFPSIVSLPLTSACLWSIGLHVMTDATARSYVGSCELQVGAGG